MIQLYRMHTYSKEIIRVQAKMMNVYQVLIHVLGYKGNGPYLYPLMIPYFHAGGLVLCM